VPADITLLEDRGTLRVVMQGGIVKAGRLAGGAAAASCRTA